MRGRGELHAATAHSITLRRALDGTAYVTDGDTVTIQKTQKRLFGIDALELHHPYGKKANWAMVHLCQGHNIRAETTIEDEYGCTVAKCFLPDGRDPSEELVKQGLAIDWPKFSGGRYSNHEVAGIRKKLWRADACQKAACMLGKILTHERTLKVKKHERPKAAFRASSRRYGAASPKRTSEQMRSIF
ncbi:MAG: thermonuclease family protein [Roseobacter sp.]